MHATVGAASPVIRAVSLVTAWTLVRSVRALEHIIADLLNLDAPAFDPWALPGAGGAGGGRGAARVLQSLVGSVAAVVSAVAHEALVDALGVVTLEVVLSAIDGAAGGRLVAGVLAV